MPTILVSRNNYSNLNYCRRIHKYPIYCPPPEKGHHNASSAAAASASASGGGGGEGTLIPPWLLCHFDGTRSYDEICCKAGVSASTLDDFIDVDPNVYVIQK